MPEAVIVATGRTPIGRANKGSLVDCRPDDLAALVIREVLDKVPAARPRRRSRTSSSAAGSRPARRATTSARVAAILAGLPDVPGVTVNRYCSSSLQTIRMAAHAIRAGEGDVFVAAGVETVSRYPHGAVRHRARTTPRSPTPRRAPRPATPAVTEPVDPARRALPDVYIAMGQTAENVAEFEKVTRQEMDEFAAARPRRGPWRVPGERVLRARDHPGHPRRRHRRHQGRRPPAGHHPGGAGRPQAGLPRGRHHHRRQRLPAQRRRRRRHRHERHQGQGSSASPRWPASWPAASPASTPRSWASVRSRPAARCWPGPT